jgi:hypothetical protein
MGGIEATAANKSCEQPIDEASLDITYKAIRRLTATAKNSRCFA